MKQIDLATLRVELDAAFVRNRKTPDPVRIPMGQSVVFVSKGEEIGRLTWDGKSLSFSGDADKSAKAFFITLNEVMGVDPKVTTLADLIDRKGGAPQ